MNSIVHFLIDMFQDFDRALSFKHWIYCASLNSATLIPQSKSDCLSIGFLRTGGELLDSYCAIIARIVIVVLSWNALQLRPSSIIGGSLLIQKLMPSS